MAAKVAPVKRNTSICQGVELLEAPTQKSRSHILSASGPWAEGLASCMDSAVVIRSRYAVVKREAAHLAGPHTSSILE